MKNEMVLPSTSISLLISFNKKYNNKKIMLIIYIVEWYIVEWYIFGIHIIDYNKNIT